MADNDLLIGVTHPEYLGEGYSVTIQHCEACGSYLGVNYPSYFCPTWLATPECVVTQKALDDLKEKK